MAEYHLLTVEERLALVDQRRHDLERDTFERELELAMDEDESYEDWYQRQQELLDNVRASLQGES